MTAQPQRAEGFGFCTVVGHQDTSPQHHASSFDGFAQYLESHVHLIPITRSEFDALDKDAQKARKNAPAVILAEFSRGGTRSRDDVLRTYGLGLDIDEQHIEFEQLKARLSGVSCVIHESVRSTADERRWRVFIEYARPFSVEEHDRAFRDWASRIPGVAGISDPSRLWYSVSRFKGSEKRIFERVQGQPYMLPQRDRQISPAEAFRRNVKPPVDMAVGEGGRNNQLSRYALSMLKSCDSEEELLDLLIEQNKGYEPPLTMREVRQIGRSKWKRREKFGWTAKTSEEVSEDEQSPVILPLMPVDFLEAPPDIPRPIVSHWLPRRVVTLFSAHGGTGKSFVALEVAVRVCLGLPVFGCEVDKTNVVFYSCEDDTSIVRSRADKLAREFGAKPKDLDGKLFVYDMTTIEEGSGIEVELFTNSKGIYGPTRTMEMLYASARDFGAGLVIIDNVSDVYAAEENVRAHVRKFMRSLKTESSNADCATLLLGHTNKATAGSKAGEDVQGYSGSTAWHNSARSRWWLARNEDNRDLLELSLEKSNYGRSGLAVEVRWHEDKGVLLAGESAKVQQPLEDLTVVLLAKLIEYEVAGVEPMVGARANGSAQGALRSDLEELKGRKATAVQEELEKLYREGMLEKTTRPSKGKGGGSVELFRVTQKGRDLVAGSSRRSEKLTGSGTGGS